MVLDKKIWIHGSMDVLLELLPPAGAAAGPAAGATASAATVYTYYVIIGAAPYMDMIRYIQ